jgi:glycosyltransferase involved in cell wall biosynthesis
VPTLAAAMASLASDPSLAATLGRAAAAAAQRFSIRACADSYHALWWTLR